MDNILQQFNGKIYSLMQNYLCDEIFEKGLSGFTEDLMKELAELGCKVTQYLIDTAEEIIFELDERKEEFESLCKSGRTLISIFGEINFKRRYYEDKKTEEKVYLLDEAMGIKPNKRLLKNVLERLIDRAVDTSYEDAGNSAAYGVKISKQEVKNEIESLDLNKDFYPEVNEKKKVENIYVIADEDHVHLQKGGIEEPRIVVVYDGIEKKGNRVTLKNKRHFGGIYKRKIDDLWEEVADYIEKSYDTDYLKTVYILGDGGSWIKTGLEWLIKSKFVLDEYHLKQAVNGIVGMEIKNKKKEIVEKKEKLRKTLRDLDFELFKEMSCEIINNETEKSKKRRKTQLMNYILNNIEGIKNLYSKENELHGCSTEGHVSHVFSDRMSSRPMGWTSTNVNNMSKLRLLKADNISIKEILEKQENVVDITEYKEIKEKAKRKMKNVYFAPVSLPIMEFGKGGKRKFFKNLLDKVVI